MKIIFTALLALAVPMVSLGADLTKCLGYEEGAPYDIVKVGSAMCLLTPNTLDCKCLYIEEDVSPDVNGNGSKLIFVDVGAANG